MRNLALSRLLTKSFVFGLLILLLVGLYFQTSRVEEPVVTLTESSWHPRNLSGDERSLYYTRMRTSDDLSLMPTKMTKGQQKELLHRMNDSKLSWEIRVLYAVVLTNQDNEKAQEFLVNQYKQANDDRIADVMLAIYWSWRMPWLEQWIGERQDANVPMPNMRWAEDIMLAALSDRRICTLEMPVGGRWTEDFTIRDLAVHYGNFQIILTDMKSKKALSVFCQYVTDELSNAPEDALFPEGVHWNGATNVVISLAELDDPSIEAVMLDVVRHAVEKFNRDGSDTDGWALEAAMKWLVDRENAAVIDIAKEGLGLDSIQRSLSNTKHEPYLKAIRDKLVDLGDGNLKDGALNRQRFARAAAESILNINQKTDFDSENE